MSNQQARDGSNQDRQFGGDEFEVNVFFFMDENYGEDETGSNAQERDDESAGGGDDHQRSRITVRKESTPTTIQAYLPPARSRV